MPGLDSPYIGLIVYLLLMLGVGFLTWGMNKSKEDFIIGGRKLGPWVVSLSERTAAESAWLILGLSGAVYWVGTGELWTAVGCVIGIILSWQLVAKPLRIESERRGAITLPEYFSQRAGGQANLVRMLSAFIIVFFFSFYVGAQFVGSAKLFNVTFGITPLAGMILGATVIVAYTMMGGFFAVCYTDVLQATFMIVTLVVMPIVGFALVVKNGVNITEALAATRHAADLFNGRTGLGAFALAFGGLSWGLGYMGQPHLVTKYMAIRNAEQIRRAKTIAIVWTVLAYSGAVLVGIVGIALIHRGLVSESLLQSASGQMDVERILPVMASLLFPAWLAGILISGAVAAMMSTADSQLLVATSAVIEDFYTKALKREVKVRRMVAYSRLVTVVVGVTGFILALTTTDLIYKMVSYAWSGLGSAFGPALVLALYWKRVNAAGIIAGMLTGAISTVVWTEIPALNDIISVRAVSFILAFVAVVAGTLLGKLPASRTA
jgi:sodium/proline symporter